MQCLLDASVAAALPLRRAAGRAPRVAPATVARAGVARAAGSQARLPPPVELRGRTLAGGVARVSRAPADHDARDTRRARRAAASSTRCRVGGAGACARRAAPEGPLDPCCHHTSPCCHARHARTRRTRRTPDAGRCPACRSQPLQRFVGLRPAAALPRCVACAAPAPSYPSASARAAALRVCGADRGLVARACARLRASRCAPARSAHRPRVAHRPTQPRRFAPAAHAACSLARALWHCGASSQPLTRPRSAARAAALPPRSGVAAPRAARAANRLRTRVLAALSAPRQPGEPYTGGVVDNEELLREKDACGVGFIASLKARAHRSVPRARRARAACDARTHARRCARTRARKRARARVFPRGATCGVWWPHCFAGVCAHALTRARRAPHVPCHVTRRSARTA
jgi:hypothetical protein